MNFFQALVNTFIPLFVAMDVFAIIGIFVALTQGLDKARSKRVTNQSVTTALLVGAGFLAIGKGVFSVLGITTDDFKIAGGLLLLIIAILDIIQAGGERRMPSGEMGIVPIGVPIIVGPAVLTALLVLVDRYGVFPTVVSFLVNLFIVWVTLKNAGRIEAVIGRGGVVALSKIMALLLAAIAIMMIRIGLQDFVAVMGRH
ncbi:MAG: MarC family protein [Actinomycetota bacterium]|nr:MarC family protein [Actinomycetota bacterium]